MYQAATKIGYLLILLIGAIEFFRMRHFPNLQNRLFTYMVLNGFLQLIVDILSPFFSAYSSPWIAYPLLIVSDLSSLLFFHMLTLYVLSLVKKLHALSASAYAWSLVPFFISLALLVTTPLTGWIYTMPGLNGNYHGPYHAIIPIINGSYHLLFLVLLVLNWKDLDKPNRNAMCLVTGLLLFAALLWSIFNLQNLAYILTTVLLTILFFRTQKPYEMTEIQTGLLNFTGMSAYINDYISEQRFFQLIFVDFSELKTHPTLTDMQANRIISQGASYLSQFGNEKCYVFRVSKYFFCILSEDKNGFDARVATIDKQFTCPFDVDDDSIDINVRLYTVPCTSFIKKFQDIIRMVEFAAAGLMYSDRITVLSKELYLQLRQREDLANHLRTALSGKGGFELLYQPIFSLKTHRFIAAEALLRLKTPQGDFMPIDFMPIAESYGLMASIDLYGLQEVSEFINRNRVCLNEQNFRINLNLAGDTFASNLKFSAFEQLLTRLDTDPGRLRFEIIEEKACEDMVQLEYYMNLLIKKGFSFDLDDFGSGFSNIARLISLPFSSVKIDKSLLYSSKKILADTLTYVRSNFNCQVIAEGVETPLHNDWLHELDIEFAQGFYYALPMSEEELCTLISAQKKAV